MTDNREFDETKRNLAANESRETLDQFVARLARNIPKVADQFFKDLEREGRRVSELRKSNTGKYRVIGIDKFDDSDWLEGEYGSAYEALSEARKKTWAAVRLATDSSIATVFYAYDPQGNYLGGDSWNSE